MKTKDERAWEAELLRSKGELLLKKLRHGDAKTVKRGEREVEECLVNAVELARSQGARKWELRAAKALLDDLS